MALFAFGIELMPLRLSSCSIMQLLEATRSQFAWLVPKKGNDFDHTGIKPGEPLISANLGLKRSKSKRGTRRFNGLDAARGINHIKSS